MTIINSTIKGKQPVIDTLNVTPTTSAQTITATGGTDGYSPVNVSAVTSSIDANIVAGNIKDGVSILGVTGNYQGTQPTGTKSITTNGIHDVTNYASADVQVPTTAPAHYIEKAVDANGKLINGSTIMDFTGVTDVGNYVLYYEYYNNTSISGPVDMSDLTTVSGSYACNSMFQGCTSITSIDLSSLTTVSGGNAFQGIFHNCTGLTSVDLSSLTTLSGYQSCSNMFRGCNGLTSVDLSALTTVSGQYACSNMFNSCTGLTTLSFPALSNNFGSYTNQFNAMLYSVTGCTVHLPSNLQSIGWLSTSFGGTNTTVLFDLPATNTLTGVDTVTYTRNPKYDTATALAWKVGAYGTTNFTPAYYTSGLTDPTVGTTIYSDAACTVSVTTVDTVA